MAKAKGFGEPQEPQEPKDGWRRFKRLFEAARQSSLGNHPLHIDITGSKLDGIPPVPKSQWAWIRDKASQEYPDYTFSLFEENRGGIRIGGIAVRKKSP